MSDSRVRGGSFGPLVTKSAMMASISVESVALAMARAALTRWAWESEGFLVSERNLLGAGDFSFDEDGFDGFDITAEGDDFEYGE